MHWPTVGTGKSYPIYLRDLDTPEKATLSWEQDFLRLGSISELQWASRVRIYCPFHDQWEWHDQYSVPLRWLYHAYLNFSPIRRGFACQEEVSKALTHYYQITFDTTIGIWILEYGDGIHQTPVTWRILSVT